MYELLCCLVEYMPENSDWLTRRRCLGYPEARIPMNAEVGILGSGVIFQGATDSQGDPGPGDRWRAHCQRMNSSKFGVGMSQPKSIGHCSARSLFADSHSPLFLYLLL